MKIALTRKLPTERLAELIDVYDEVRIMEEHRPLTPAEIKDTLEGAQIAIVNLTDPINRHTISDSLLYVITYSVGVDHLDLSLLKERNIGVSHTPDVLTDATADLAWGLLLACARQIPQANDYTKSGQFRGFGPQLFLGKRVMGKTLGILGMGRIGRAVAERGKGFHLSVFYHNRNPLSDEQEKQLNAKWVDFETLLRESDFLSIHCPLTEHTRHLISDKELGLMKWNACIINTARGPVLDERALLHHLKLHPEMSAGLDVYEKEPQIPKELLEMDNIVCLPHIGSADRPTRETMANICVDEAIRFAKGDQMEYALTL